MKGTIAEKLEQQVNRRSFLRGSGLAAMAVLGTAAFARAAVQDQEKAPGKSTTGEDSEQAGKGEDEKGSANADKKDESAPAENEPRVTLTDDRGREYRVCPECGSNMYRQDTTWTCENCGYSYTE